MRTWLGRKRASENHPALRHVDRLLSGRPDELEVRISGLPDQLEELVSVYEPLFKLRDYRVVSLDRDFDDLWVARLERANR